MKSDMSHRKRKTINSLKIRIAMSVFTGLLLLAGWIGWVTRPDPVPENENERSAKLVELMTVAQEANSSTNYFTRKIALVRMVRQLDQLSTDPNEQFKAELGESGVTVSLTPNAVKPGVKQQLFSRKEWLGF